MPIGFPNALANQCVCSVADLSSGSAVAADPLLGKETRVARFDGQDDLYVIRRVIRQDIVCLLEMRRREVFPLRLRERVKMRG